jgi:hypothetical protein
VANPTPASDLGRGHRIFVAYRATARMQSAAGWCMLAP